MPKSFVTLAWVAAACAYLLIVLGAVVRISGSGMGCGDHWPLCNGHLFPPLNEIPTVIEWSHRLLAALVSVLVLALAALALTFGLQGQGMRCRKRDVNVTYGSSRCAPKCFFSTILKIASVRA